MPAAHPGLDDRELDAKAVEQEHQVLRLCSPIACPAYCGSPLYLYAFKRLPHSHCAKMPGSERLLQLVVLASGSGTNLQAILDTLHGREGIEVVGVGSDKPDALGAGAGRRSRAWRPRSSRATSTRTARRATPRWRTGSRRAAPTWSSSPATCSCSAPTFVARFRNRIVNVHPALLPAFPGLDAIGQALEAGVDDDRGDRPLRRRGRRHRAADPPARGGGASRAAIARSWRQAIHAVEHELYPEAIRMIAEGRVRIDADDPRRVVIDD